MHTWTLFSFDNHILAVYKYLHRAYTKPLNKLHGYQLRDDIKSNIRKFTYFEGLRSKNLQKNSQFSTKECPEPGATYEISL